ncbi:glycosyl transferase family 90-domain-containing protein [Pelagophyceae sp. CCMP2097]|nr:glycosyl transferase family 90-domain-containing protein [Pelagophyceae sp. CCMP2097]
MTTHAPISTAHEVRGIYALADEAHAWLRGGWPKFQTSAECIAFVKKNCGAKSNPQRPHMTQMITMLVSWEQVDKYLLKVRGEYNARWPPQLCTQAFCDEAAAKNVWAGEAGAFAGAEMEVRLDLPMHRRLNAFAVEATLSYLFDHMRCGIYVMIRRNQVAMFVPFVNGEFRNTWGHLLQVQGNTGNDEYYARKRSETGSRAEMFLPDRQEWWANGNIMCNEHSKTNEPAEASQLWGDRFGAALRDMLDAMCAERTVGDCEFFVNKRDYPQIKYHEDSDDEEDGPARGEAVEPYGFVVDQDDRDADADVSLPRAHRDVSLAPVCSFYCSERFADVPWPTSEDWEAAIGTILPPSFDHEVRGNDVVLQVEPRDLFTEEKFRKFECTWEEKVETAFFRGTATGGGVSAATNQRLALTTLCYDWRRAASAKPAKKYSPSEQFAKLAGSVSPPLLDSEITGWNTRDKKLGAAPMTYIRKDRFPFSAGKNHFVPIFQQSRYKYLIYVEGHCAACRYGFMMRLGSVILKVESKCVADTMWFFPLLRPFVDHVPVRADLSDLADQIRWCKTHDAECRAIAKNAEQLWTKYLAREGLLDYIQLATNKIARRFEYGPSWLFGGAPGCAAPEAALHSRKVDPPVLRREGKQTYSQHSCIQGELCGRCDGDRSRDEDRRRRADFAAAALRAAETGAAAPTTAKKRPADDAADAGSQRARMKKRAQQKKDA